MSAASNRSSAVTKTATVRMHPKIPVVCLFEDNLATIWLAANDVNPLQIYAEGR